MLGTVQHIGPFKHLRFVSPPCLASHGLQDNHRAPSGVPVLNISIDLRCQARTLTGVNVLELDGGHQFPSSGAVEFHDVDSGDAVTEQCVGLGQEEPTARCVVGEVIFVEVDHRASRPVGGVAHLSFFEVVCTNVHSRLHSSLRLPAGGPHFP